MPTNILMPALSPTMEKGNLARWLKKEGDKIKSGDVIAEIETDKATMEYEAVDEGTLAKIVVPEGTQDVAVNSVIAVLAGEGEDVKAAAAAAKAAPAKAPEKKAGSRAGHTKASPQRQESSPAVTQRRNLHLLPSKREDAAKSRSGHATNLFMAIAFFRRHWLAVSQRRPALTWAACRDPVRMAA